MLEKLELIWELSHLFSGVDVHLVSRNEAEIRTHLTQTLSRKLGADWSNLPIVTQICALDSTHIYEYTPFPGITLLIYSCTNTDHTLFIGPAATENYTTHNLIAYLQQRHIPQNDIVPLVESLSQLPVCPIHTLYRFSDIALRHLCGVTIPIPVKRMETGYDFAPLPVFVDALSSNDIHHIRQIEDRYKGSAVLTEAVKLGNLSLALQPLRKRGGNDNLTMRNLNPLRNMQNYCIVLNTQLRHALEESGIHPYDLDRLSNEIGLQIERLTSPDAATSFNSYIIEQYCRLVQEHSYQNLSAITHQAVIYIKNNLSSNLTVKDTAKELSVHPDYLSHQFSQEMGMTFIAFLNQERCRQAASYLRHTNLQIKQISAIVGFNTISYFTKQFSHIYGKTPRDFRNEQSFPKQVQSS